MATPDPDADVTAARSDSVLPRTPRRYAQEVQFAPGTLVAERYRISSILGKGGMGEVFRADDIKLGQTVALKFLPAKLALDSKLLDQLHDEVRLGRQVAHPNVCRIYDIGEWGNAHFVAMEYVDGEDMARLLHRIGRLPHDKAVDITRGIAAGLAAAHAKGILHRDLKPANVMIDSQGDARITDFGLALTDDADQEDAAGTPAYMAPEVLEGGGATIQSDLYALGLVMYEIFTGKRLYSGGSVQELRREKSSDITTPSNIVRDIEPSVERVILRCLAHDPAQRPRSAREVILSLPGGDPLAAALAAGETPSPKLVAAAGTEGSLSRRAAWTLLAVAALLFAAQFAIRRTTAVSKYVSLDRSPEVLRQRAGEILHELGIAVRGTPIAHFSSRREYFAWLTNRAQRNRWEALQNGPPLLIYHLEYGFSPEQSHVINTTRTATSGNTAISVDPHGRLAFLLAAPGAPVKPRPLDWRPLLDATGVDVASLRAIPPQHAPPVPFDARGAWSGTYSGDATPIRLEAAAWQGTPVFLRITGAWDEEADPLARVAFESNRGDLFMAIVSLIIVVSAILLAWRNLRLRRGDRQGALRVAIAYFAIDALARLLTADYPTGLVDLIPGVWRTVMPAAAGALLLYALYIALEPFARKKWPEQLISWTRLLAGRVRDPMVGRDTLIGVVAGLVHGVLSHGGRLLASWLSRDEVVPLFFGGRYLSGFRYMLGEALSSLLACVIQALAVIMVLVLLTIILRKRALAAGALFLLLLTMFTLWVAGQPELIPVYAAVAALAAFVAVRYGVIAFAAMQTTFFILFQASPETSSWMVGLSMVPVVAIVAFALWAFRVSLGGQTLWHPDLLDE